MPVANRLVLLLVAVAAACSTAAAAAPQPKVFTPPAGYGSVTDYCRYLKSANHSVVAALDAEYESAGAAGETPRQVAGGPVCTLGCQIGSDDQTNMGLGFAGKCWGLNGTDSQANCLSTNTCTVAGARAQAKGGSSIAGADGLVEMAQAISGRGTAWHLSYPPGSAGARLYDTLEKAHVTDSYYSRVGARNHTDFYDEFRQVGSGFWLGRSYVRQSSGALVLMRRFGLFLTEDDMKQVQPK